MSRAGGGECGMARPRSAGQSCLWDREERWARARVLLLHLLGADWDTEEIMSGNR